FSGAWSLELGAFNRYDSACLLSVIVVLAVQHRSGRRVDAPQRHHRPDRHRTDAQRRQPELHRLLALRRTSEGADRRDVRDFFHWSRGGGSGGRPGADYRGVSALQDDEYRPDGFDEGINSITSWRHFLATAQLSRTNWP